MDGVTSLHEPDAQDADADSIPPHLFERIEQGHCVAFVGAGFSVPAGLPRWVTLIQRIAEADETPSALREHIRILLSKGAPTAHELDQAAQMLSDVLGNTFVERLRGLLTPANPLPERMRQRLRWLHGIPFGAILTTNADGLLRGVPPTREQFRRVLRREGARWWRETFWDDTAPVGAVLKLHGDLLAESGREGLVFTREDYRRLLYRDSTYREFLRNLFSISTILFLGFSFEDAYLNELRSEVLAFLGHREDQAPLAYAVINDVPPVVIEHFRRHEGICILSYDSSRPPEFQGFEHILKTIYDRTSALGHFGRVLAGKRILWMDPNPENNTRGFEFFRNALAARSTGQLPLVMVPNPERAIGQLKQSRFDLVLSHWGGEPDDQAPGATLLIEMRRHDLRAPVLIFSGAAQANERKRLALSLGAQDYCFKFETLFRRIEEVFTEAAKTG